MPDYAELCRDHKCGDCMRCNFDRMKDVIAAYIFDRAHQYTPSSGYVTALCDLASDIRKGEAHAAFAHGELDDILARWGVK